MAVVKPPRDLRLTETERTFRVELSMPEAGGERWFDIHREILLTDDAQVLHARSTRMLRRTWSEVAGEPWQVPDGPLLSAQNVSDFLEVLFDQIAAFAPPPPEPEPETPAEGELR